VLLRRCIAIETERGAAGAAAARRLYTTALDAYGAVDEGAALAPMTAFCS
jgi:hypothetical protein